MFAVSELLEPQPAITPAATREQSTKYREDMTIRL
jgi:hypothetical protein